MGVRKRKKADETKEANKLKYFATLNNNPTSPRKMRLVANLIRNVEVDNALHILKHCSKEAAGKMEKLLLSAMANWQQKNEGVRIEDSNLFVKEVFVDGGRILKRIQPAPQGRAHRVKKRSNHVTLVIDSRFSEKAKNEIEVNKEKEVKIEKEVKKEQTKAKKIKKEQ